MRREEKNCPRILLAAPKSGSGKTFVTCALLAALKGRGKRAAAFKCGPDYIDPMFHETVLETSSKNLDTYFADESLTRYLFLEEIEETKAEIAVIEGVMGYYDGLGGVSVKASAYEAAAVLDAPALLIVDAVGSSVSLCALIKGFLEFQRPSRIAGVILNRASAMFYPRLKELIEGETGLPVCGYLPVQKDISLESRHLGLVLPQELSRIQEDLQTLGERAAETLDLRRILKIAERAPALKSGGINETEKRVQALQAELDFREAERPVIAVARDKAFSFYYKDNLKLLEKLGAKLAVFSPLGDTKIPEEADALLLGGGYPELYGEALGQNGAMRQSVREAIVGGMPYLAECGGFLYLQKILADKEGKTHAMAGVLEGSSRYTGKLSRFGYVELELLKDQMLGKAGTVIKGHEFHYMDTDSSGECMRARKPAGGRSWTCGHGDAAGYAGFPHLYLYSNPDAAAAFVRAAARYHGKKNKFGKSREKWTE